MNKSIFVIIILLLFGMLGCSNSPKQKISVKEYQDKVYASWLAQCIGNIYGLPHECQYVNEPGPENFPYGYGNNARYLKETNGAFSDDDTDIEYMYLLTMEKHGPEPTYKQLADSWMYHVRDRVWLANRAAVSAMNFGYTPPVTGLKEYNPHWFQIDPQLVNEIWAVTSPGMIQYAAGKSAWAARITNDSWGIYPTIHYGAMYAAAFFESDINKIIDIGTSALPPGSRFIETVEDMKALHQKYPNDWRKAWQEMADKYYINEPEDTKTIWNAVLNGACGILALLYGEGDFQKTLDLACALGFDADNQAATMSGLLGVIYGTKGLPKDLLYPFPELNWEEPFNDLYKNVSRFDMPDGSLKDMAAKTAQMGEKIILGHGGKKVTEDGVDYYLINPRAQYTAPLEFPSGPMPVIEAGKPVNHAFLVSGGTPPYNWSVLKGQFPEGLVFDSGRITGTAVKSGVYPVILQIEQNNIKIQNEFTIIVRGENLAPEATEILANVKTTNTKVRDAMWLTVGRSLYAEKVDVIRDGRFLGEGSTFYSIDASSRPKVDYYGYKWNKIHQIGMIGYHTGAMEENGGWFSTLNVEYLDRNGKWQKVDDLLITPQLVQGKQPHNKPHFIEYLLVFEPVNTNAVRIIGQAGNARHWVSKPSYFTSISELTIHSPLNGYENLASRSKTITN